jgi:hypothetical protein
MRASDVFHFLRGALRGAYGIEDLRERRFLIVGLSDIGQDLLGHLCVDGVDIRFQDSSMKNYRRSFAACRDVDFYEGGEVDVIVDFDCGLIVVNEKAFPINKISTDPYTQGIHEFYL